MKANVYIDGFNLYYGALKGTAFRWLNIETLCRLMLPLDTIHQIKYFSALVDPRPGDPAQRTRQQTYFRALRTIPNLSIILGSFLTHEITMPLASSKGGFARVIKTEEKGSDVNIATHLLMDGFRNEYEIAIVVSNDSDLLLPIRVVTEQLGKPVGLLNPQKHPSTALLPYVRFVKQIRAGVLAKSQFSSTLKDQQGTFTKPPKW
jgi:hypothetical protein